jgi:hypothetical protein
MKKIFTRSFTFSLLTAFLIVTFYACKKSANRGNIDLTGKWVKTEFQGIMSLKAIILLNLTYLQQILLAKQLSDTAIKVLGNTT